ncbi:MAG TPA: hypothetical protein VMM35_02380 [Longimicrobiales bacterium]|nr:hypothetical protein [Longimicrobiales bacterium]
MIAEPAGARAGLEPGASVAPPGELVAQYAAYRRRQARGLIRLLPREAVRPLYRRALAEGFDVEAAGDPLGALLSYCEQLLPLPPFDVWREDVRRHGTAHLQDLDDSAEAPTAEAPTTVVTRRFKSDDEPWIAHLRSYRERETWRGYIAFEDERTHRVHRTALIFRESDPVHVRERFLDFDLASLQAFLRSALP